MFKSFRREPHSLTIKDTEFTDVITYDADKYISLEETFLEIIKAYKKRNLNYQRAFADAMYFNYETEVHRSTIWNHSTRINQKVGEELIKVSDMRCIRRWLASKNRYYSNSFNVPESAVIDEN